MTDEPELKPRARAFETIFYGGLAIGILYMLDAFAYFSWYLGVGVQVVFRAVAAGIVGGEEAGEGGWGMFAFGLALHFVISFIIAAIYFAATRLLPVMLRHPILFGLAYGVVCHFVMQYAVFPLSAIGTPHFSVERTIHAVIAHALLVGLPVALIAAWSAKRQAKS